jgi:hypothetical protein
MCEWGRKREDYLKPPPEKTAKNIICDFSPALEHSFRHILKDFRKHITVDTYTGEFATIQFDHLLSVAERLKIMGSYKFVLITESVFEEDWFVFHFEEFSQLYLQFYLFILSKGFTTVVTSDSCWVGTSVFRSSEYY